MLLDPLDFEPRDWVPGSGWPIPRQALAQYYTEAARALELPQLQGDDLSRFLQPLTDDEQRMFAQGDFRPTVSLWARNTQRFGTGYLKRLRRESAARALLHASAIRLELAATGDDIVALHAGTLAGNRFTVRARQYVLACGGIENARLLLASRDRAPAGIGNEQGHVGRCFMDHPRTVYGRVQVPAGIQLRAFRGRPLPDGKLQVGMGLSPDVQRRERLLNHYVTFELQTSGYAEARYQAMVQTAKVLLRRGHTGSRWDLGKMRLRELPEMVYLLSPKELMPHWMYRAFVAARDSLPRRPAPQTYIVVYFCEQPPDPASRVTLTDQFDALGMPRIHLHWHIGEQVRDSVRRMQDLLAARLAAAGLGRLEPGSGEMTFTDASHHMGTTRMSASPVDGVVDTDCRVHGVRNLYVAGSSVFPSAGFANPTLSIVALSLRLARHLAAAR
jgi:choline dehydrogenase-like flavoprotein